MSVDIAAALREEAKKARDVAARLGSPEDTETLTRLAATLAEIAERLERDARD
jgi:hypothetical protein